MRKSRKHLSAKRTFFIGPQISVAGHGPATHFACAYASCSIGGSSIDIGFNDDHGFAGIRPTNVEDALFPSQRRSADDLADMWVALLFAYLCFDVASAGAG